LTLLGDTGLSFLHPPHPPQQPHMSGTVFSLSGSIPQQKFFSADAAQMTWTEMALMLAR